MKLILIILTILSLGTAASAQKYSFTFKTDKATDSVMYLGQHFRDKLIILDTAKVEKGVVRFDGTRQWKRGVYVLIDQTKNKGVLDFMIDDSQTITFTLKGNSTKVKGSESNQKMFDFLAYEESARAKAKELEERDDRTDAAKELEALNRNMQAWEDREIEKNKKYLFFELLGHFRGVQVPEEIEDKPYYYRQHYWDGIDLSNHDFIYTPNLFNKVNYYFFGLLYHSDKDTICKYADLFLEKIENDSTMMNYVMEFIMPKYYRSTKNIGWDATWCYLVKKYYLTGKCPWATKGELTNKIKTMQFLEKSLIGARGAELWMADTNQSSNPQDWISSHRLSYPYVILWFWDPDCHHCQEQTATLKALYDSLSVSDIRPRPFEVYAVGYESDVEKWKAYVKEHELPFVNVGGPNVNIDYQEAYNVHGAPTMIILNHKREIIMNKTLPTEAIIPFLEEYEKKNNLDLGWREPMKNKH